MFKHSAPQIQTLLGAGGTINYTTHEITKIPAGVGWD